MGFLARDKKPIRSIGIEWVAIPFSFIPNASDTTLAPVSSNVVGPLTVSVTSTGLYHCILPGGAPRMVVELGQVETALKGLFECELGNTNATSGFFQVRVFNYGTTTLVNFTATTSMQKVHGTVWLQASSYTR